MLALVRLGISIFKHLVHTHFFLLSVLFFSLDSFILLDKFVLAEPKCILIAF